jgi:hypothetical protein
MFDFEITPNGEGVLFAERTPVFYRNLADPIHSWL